MIISNNSLILKLANVSYAKNSNLLHNEQNKELNASPSDNGCKIFFSHVKANLCSQSVTCCNRPFSKDSPDL